MRERDAALVRDAVDRPLDACRQLHHEQLGVVVRPEELEEVLES